MVALTAAFASDRFGVKNLGTIYGMMFAVMPLGSGFGAALGGFLYDARGTYDLAIWSNLILLVISVVLILTISRAARKARGCRRNPRLSRQ